MSLFYQFPFEYITVEDKQVGGYSSRRALMNSVFLNLGIYVLLMLFWKSLRICFFQIYQIYVLEMSSRPAFQCLLTLYLFERRSFITEGN